MSIPSHWMASSKGIGEEPLSIAEFVSKVSARLPIANDVVGKSSFNPQLSLSSTIALIETRGLLSVMHW